MLKVYRAAQRILGFLGFGFRGFSVLCPLLRVVGHSLWTVCSRVTLASHDAAGHHGDGGMKMDNGEKTDRAMMTVHVNTN